jgi:uncharacterized protein YoxC
MNDILLNTGVVVFIVFALSSIVYHVNTYRTGTAVRKFIRESEANIQATVTELRATLENIRKITENIGAVAEDVRYITDTVADLNRSVRDLYGFVKESVASTMEADIAGLKAGVKTGVKTLIKNLAKERGEHHERGA